MNALSSDVSVTVFANMHTHTNTCTHTHTQSHFMALLDFVRTTRISQNQKGKTRKVNLDLLEQEIVSGSGISWAIRKSAP